MIRGRWLLAGAVAAVILWWLVPALLRRSDFFRVERVELVGIHNLPEQVILDALGIPPDANVFDDFEAARSRVAEVAGVRRVEIGRRLPSTLRVRLDETLPVALTPKADRMMLVDPSGEELPFDPARSAPDLPVLLRGDSATARLLDRIRLVEPALFAAVSVAREVDGDVVLDLDGHRIWLRPDASPEAIRSVVAVAEDLARNGKTYAELDGRFAAQVIVRWRPV